MGWCQRCLPANGLCLNRWFDARFDARLIGRLILGLVTRPFRAAGFAAMLLASLWLSLPLGADEAMRAPDYAATQIHLLPGQNRPPMAFDVRLALSPSQHAHGLMFSPRLPPKTGMLFVFAEAGPRAFWMKNTPIALDMLFFAADGSLVTLITNAVPHSLTLRRSTAPAQYVLEIGGGEAARLGLGAGTLLRLPLPALANRAGSEEK